jgi:hypothetical protein
MKCQRMCTHECENLPRMFSFDPDEFPLEEGIAPLVLELRRTGLFTTCLSCEGHLGASGELWKLPQVWFYSASPAHVRLFSEMLKLLESRKATGTNWSTGIKFSDPDNPDMTFSLAPQLATGEDAVSGAAAIGRKNNCLRMARDIC